MRETVDVRMPRAFRRPGVAAPLRFLAGVAPLRPHPGVAPLRPLPDVAPLRPHPDVVPLRPHSGAVPLRRHAGAVLLAVACLGGCGQREPAPQQVPGGSAERGRQLLVQFQCGACHTIPGVEAARSTAGPPLDTFGRQSYVAGRLPNYPEPLVRWIVDPPAVKPGTLMPRLGVSPDDARHMAAYLYTLR